MAKLEKESLTFGVQRNGESYSSYLDNQDKELDKLVKKSLTLPKGEIKGGVFKVQIADGYAYYLVTKVRPLTVQHIHVGDAWRIPEAHIRGLNKADIVQFLEGEKFLHNLFKNKK